MERRKVIRIREQDLAGLLPVTRYARPSYPTRDEASDLGIDLYRVPDSLLRRFGRRAVAGATMLLLSTTASCEGAYVDPCPLYGALLSEDEARRIVDSRLAEEGITFESDYQYVSGSLDVNLDGYDPVSGIGYEYYSAEDREECREKCCGSGWDLVYADVEERASFERLVDSPGGSAVYFFDTELYSSSASVERELEQQVREFIDWLVFHGRLWP